MEPLLVDTKTLEKMLAVSPKTAKKIGEAAGARVQIGRAVRWKLSLINEYLDKLAGK